MAIIIIPAVEITMIDSAGSQEDQLCYYQLVLSYVDAIVLETV